MRVVRPIKKSQLRVSDVEPEEPVSRTNGKSCFVVMPFGTKQMPHGSKETVNFDAVYRQIIKPTATRIGLQCTRSDEVSEAGLIHKDMIDRIIKSDVVIVDITTVNPNVFYELGIRHTARRSGTILMKMLQKPIPFNINGMRVIEYDLTPKAIPYSRSILETNIKNSMIERNVDSLVHTLLPGLNVTQRPSPIETTEVTEYGGESLNQVKLGIVTGDIMKVGFVDVWVNPENTKMQMARWHDDSISANIRYFGAVRDANGYVRNDTIAAQLRAQIGRSGVVEAGTVIETGPGELRRTNCVRVILHVAGMHGEPGRGYLPIRGYAVCIHQALKKVDQLNRGLGTRAYKRTPLKSIIIPLFGTRSGGDPQDVTDRLVRTAKSYFEEQPTTSIDRVYFLAYTDADRELCQTAFSRLGLREELRKVEQRGGNGVIMAPRSGANGGETTAGEAKKDTPQRRRKKSLPGKAKRRHTAKAGARPAQEMHGGKRMSARSRR